MGVYGFVLGGGDGGVWPSISPDGGLPEGYDPTSWNFLSEEGRERFRRWGFQRKDGLANMAS